MSTEITIARGEDKTTLKLGGRFDFNANRDFRRAYESVLDGGVPRAIDVDLSGVDYLDSSALGMLLLLKEKADAARARVTLVGGGGTVRQILEVANFDKLFEMR
jgi:anti-anti-sigma factor